MENKTDQIVFDPRGVVETEPLGLSPRAAELNELRLGVLDNAKWNANRLLRKPWRNCRKNSLLRP